MMMMMLLLLALSTIISSSHAKRPFVPTSIGNIRRSSQTSHHYYTLYDSPEVHYKLLELKERYPDFVTLETAQEKYGLPSVGDEKDCVYERWDSEGNEINDSSYIGCKNYILTIEDKIAHSSDGGGETAKYLPEVFLSGALHGDERVGPTAVMETISLILEAAMCESIPRSTFPLHDKSSNFEKDLEEWEDDVDESKRCMDNLSNRGIDKSTRQWLARLVTTRRIVVMPTANALGFDRKRRDEGVLDPNRDFGYDLKTEGDDNSSKDCMQTITARSINEVFRDHIFQLAVTFHAGMEAIAYEWGAPSYEGHFSPDHESQTQISNALGVYSGKIDSRAYPVDTMNDLVYSVRGGMEDWAYAGSWDHKHSVKCSPTTYGIYPIEKTTYEDYTLRAFNVLIETSASKLPRENTLGISQDLFSSSSLSKNNGHVSRNIRLSLLMIDMVEPYVSVVSVGERHISNDIIPRMKTEKRSCMKTKVFRVSAESEYIDLKWIVGGSIQVDETRLMYAKWSDLHSSFDGINQPDEKHYADLLHLSKKTNKKHGKQVYFTDIQTGFTEWHKESEEIVEGSHHNPSGTSFTATVNLSHFKHGDKIAVFALAKVDESWSSHGDYDVKPDINPQTHIANVRTNPEWHYQTKDGTKAVQGRLRWFSIPVTLQLVESSTSIIEEISVRSPVEELKATSIEGLSVFSARTLFVVLTSILLILFMMARFELYKICGGIEKKRSSAGRRSSFDMMELQKMVVVFKREEEKLT